MFRRARCLRIANMQHFSCVLVVFVVYRKRVSIGVLSDGIVGKVKSYKIVGTMYDGA